MTVLHPTIPFNVEASVNQWFRTQAAAITLPSALTFNYSIADMWPLDGISTPCISLTHADISRERAYLGQQSGAGELGVDAANLLDISCWVSKQTPTGARNPQWSAQLNLLKSIVQHIFAGPTATVVQDYRNSTSSPTATGYKITFSSLNGGSPVQDPNPSIVHVRYLIRYEWVQRTGSAYYTQRVLDTEKANLLQFLRLNEVGGTVAGDSSGNAYTGAYSNVTLNAATFIDGSPVPSFNGSNGYVNAFTAALASAAGNVMLEGSFIIWAKVDASFWTDDLFHYFGRLRQADTDNEMEWYKSGTVDNRIGADYQAGGTTDTRNSDGNNTTDWFCFAFTWSTSNDRARLYLNGVQQGADLSTLGTPVNVLTHYNIGQSLGSNFFLGNLCNVGLWNKELTAAQIASLSVI